MHKAFWAAHECLRELSTFISFNLAPSKTFKDPKGVLRSGWRVRGVVQLQSGKHLERLGSINHGAVTLSLTHC